MGTRAGLNLSDWGAGKFQGKSLLISISRGNKDYNPLLSKVVKLSERWNWDVFRLAAVLCCMILG
uniref:Uncharacterized protein n=1 Tax=Desertifilum tharense IPPAS B-1220 TaxID=1781255 RepID=A0A1E5QNM8_9CYAN|nr:hypothetical protein BH720_05365 [Desertifilum tharense IPPAS B-1220]